MKMDMAEDFSERDPGELLAECIGDILCDDLYHNVVTDNERDAGHAGHAMMQDMQQRMDSMATAIGTLNVELNNSRQASRYRSS
jgi:hypothetical protein